MTTPRRSPPAPAPAPAEPREWVETEPAESGNAPAPEAGARSGVEPARSVSRGEVKYVGTGDIREITAQQLRLAGYPNGETVAWSARNGFAVPLNTFADWPDGLFDQVIKQDRSFVIVGDVD